MPTPDSLIKVSISSLPQTTIQALLDYVESKTGMIFAARLHTWVLKQLEKVCNAKGITDVNLFITELMQDRKPREASAFFESLTVHETMFFRDKKYFDFMEATMFPDLIKSNSATKSLKIWIAAGSSGQEAYSILFLLKLKFPELSSWNLQILSTDLSQQIVDKGKEGIYEKHEIERGLEQSNIDKFFDDLGDGRWQVKSQYRSEVRFMQSNLVEDFAYAIPKADFISCRNVLIYFDDETKYDIIKRLAQKTDESAYLLLGQVDYINAGPVPEHFEQKFEKGFPYYKNIL